MNGEKKEFHMAMKPEIAGLWIRALITNIWRLSGSTKLSTSNERVWCTTQLAKSRTCLMQLAKLKLSFNHSIGCAHSWRFSFFYKKCVSYLISLISYDIVAVGLMLGTYIHVGCGFNRLSFFVRSIFDPDRKIWKHHQQCSVGVVARVRRQGGGDSRHPTVEEVWGLAVCCARDLFLTNKCEAVLTHSASKQQYVLRNPSLVDYSSAVTGSDHTLSSQTLTTNVCRLILNTFILIFIKITKKSRHK